MYKLSILFIAALLIIACTPKNENSDSLSDIDSKPLVKDTTPRVCGIGGIFFKSENPAEAKEWYRKNLGLAVDDFGAPFEFRNANRPDEVNYLNWDAFPDSTEYFLPSQKEFMINYRVQNIEGLLRILKQNKVTILGEITNYEYGKFLYIMDSEGNKIELWEPVDSVLTQMGRATTK